MKFHKKKQYYNCFVSNLDKLKENKVTKVKSKKF